MNKSRILNGILLSSLLFASVPAVAAGTEKIHFGRRTGFELASGLALGLIALTSKNKVEGAGFGAFALYSLALAAQDSGLASTVGEFATQTAASARTTAKRAQTEASRRAGDVHKVAGMAVCTGRKGTAGSLRSLLLNPLVWLNERLNHLIQWVEPAQKA